MSGSMRQQRFAKMIQKDLGEIFQRDTRGITGNAFITVADVRMSPDLGVAKIYISMMLVDDKQGILGSINERKSEIRRLLGNKIGKQVRVVPELVFYIDEVEENAYRIDKIIDNLDIPKNDEPPADKPGDSKE